MFDANIMCDSIIEDIKRIDYSMSLVDIQTIIHQNIDKYDDIFISKSIEEKNLIMKECCCYINRLSTTMLFDHDIDLTLNDCVIGVTINNESDDKSVENVDNNNDRVDNTCVKYGKHCVVVVVVVSDRNASQNDETSDEWQMENEEQSKVRIKKTTRRSKNKTGFPRPKKKIIRKSMNTIKDNRSANPITDKSRNDSNQINSNKKTLCFKKQSNKRQSDKCFTDSGDQNNNQSSEYDNNDNEDEEEKYVKFMGSTFRARDLMKKCKSCDPSCELDELTIAFNVMMSAENDDDLPSDLRKQCRIDSNSDCSDFDNNSQQIAVNSNCGDFSDDLDIIDVNDIYLADNDNDWFCNDMLNDGVNDFLAQTSNSTLQTLPFDASLQTINFDQSFVCLPSTSGYGNAGVNQPTTSDYCNTGFGPIINNVHTMSQKIIINNVMPTTSSTQSSDLLQSSELPQDLLDITFDDMIDIHTNIACDSDAISITGYDPEVLVTQSGITFGKSVTDNHEQTSDKSLNITSESVVLNNDSDNNAVKKKKAMKRSHDN